MTNPANLEHEEFHDWIAKNLNYKNDWKELLTSETIERTADSLDGLISSLKQQLADYGDAPNPDPSWSKRTKNMLAMAESRMRQIDRHTSKASQVSQWKAFAHDLVDIINDSDMDAELDIEMAPFGGLTAREWRDRRDEKRGVVA